MKINKLFFVKNFADKQTAPLCDQSIRACLAYRDAIFGVFQTLKDGISIAHMTEQNLLPSGLPRIESLEMRGIVKKFPGVLANDNVNFDVKRVRFTRFWVKTVRAKAR